MEQNTPSELLTRLLDGELESAEESGVFRSLAENEELQHQMQELLAIRQAVRQDTEAFTPPADATVGVFTRLGYTPPAAAGIIKNTSPLWKKLIKRAAAPAMLLLLVSLGSLYFANNNNGSLAETSHVQPVKSETHLDVKAVKTVASLNDMGAVNSNANSRRVISNNNIAHSNLPNTSKWETAASNDNVVNTVSTLPVENNSANQFEKPVDIALAKIDGGLGSNGFSSGDYQHTPMQQKPDYSFNSGKTATVYFKTSFSQNRQEFNTPGSESILPVEGLIGGYLYTKNGISFGLEVGYQSFSRLKNDEQYKRYEINQNVAWAVPFARYDIDVNLFGVQPYVQAGFGISSLALMMRGSFGLDYNLSSSVGLTVGYEYSKILNYPLQNFDGTTDKLSTSRGGINAGFLLRF